MPGKTAELIFLAMAGSLVRITPAARAAEGLVGGRRGDVRVRDRRRVQAGRDQPGEVRHVDHEAGADLVGDRPEALEVELPRVGGPAGDDHLRPVLAGQPLDLVHVDQAVALAHLVGHDLEHLARVVDLHAVGEVAAVGQAEAEDRVARLQQGEEHRRVGLRARVRLHVGELGAEQRLHPVDRQLLGDVDVLAAAVVPPARVALGVLVGQHRALRLHHRDRGEVLRGDHLQRRLLAVQLGGDGRGHLGVDLGQRLVELGSGDDVQCVHGDLPRGNSGGWVGANRVAAGRWRRPQPRSRVIPGSNSGSAVTTASTRWSK